MSAYQQVQANLKAAPRRWLVTGAAGFIGSNIVETLLRLDQQVTGFDNFATGKPANLEQIKQAVSPAQWGRFKFIEGDLRKPSDCQTACQGIELVSHQGALGSVPRSIADPHTTHEVNVTGTLNLFLAARAQGVRRVVYASSSSVYGDHPGLPKVEDQLGQPLSPYAASKLMNEIYAGVLAQTHGLDAIGLRYFNVFGPRQDPEGPYAAVIPKWLAAMLKGETIYIYGDGETSRDFCYVANAVQANILAAVGANDAAKNQAFNIAVGERASLNQLFTALQTRLAAVRPGLKITPPVYQDFRPGDVRHSLADITRARLLLGYEPTHTLDSGLDEALEWYLANS